MTHGGGVLNTMYANYLFHVMLQRFRITKIKMYVCMVVYMYGCVSVCARVCEQY